MFKILFLWLSKQFYSCEKCVEEKECLKKWMEKSVFRLIDFISQFSNITSLRQILNDSFALWTAFKKQYQLTKRKNIYIFFFNNGAVWSKTIYILGDADLSNIIC